ncbi:hypothetical protein Leryth_025370 [Lithospermum erythrorhizon]|nr:hypothetical protein Leryth_025370 [Lithospermum erythrorhizon]
MELRRLIEKERTSDLPSVKVALATIGICRSLFYKSFTCTFTLKKTLSNSITNFSLSNRRHPPDLLSAIVAILGSATCLDKNNVPYDVMDSNGINTSIMSSATSSSVMPSIFSTNPSPIQCATIRALYIVKSSGKMLKCKKQFLRWNGKS